MRIALVLTVTAALAAGGAHALDTPTVVAVDRDVASEFGIDLFKFGVELYKLISRRYKGQFVASPYGVWLTLSALAEGTDGPARQELFDILNLPQDDVVRRQYYEAATSLEPVEGGTDVMFSRNRYLVLDNGAQVNESWAHDVLAANRLEVVSAPLISDKQGALQRLRELISSQIPSLDISGYSVLLDSLDYKNIWTMAFPEAKIKPNAPFYDNDGKQIGTVDLMYMRKYVKLARRPLLNAKVIQVPVGVGERYGMFLLISTDNTPISRTIELFTNTVLTDIFANIQESLIPLEIAIPRFNITTDLWDLRDILEEMGLRKVWGDAAATNRLSLPAAAPSALVQRVSARVEPIGIEPYAENWDDSQFLAQIGSGASPDQAEQIKEVAAGMAKALGRDFIANQPFAWAVIDMKSRSALLAGEFSTPNAN